MATDEPNTKTTVESGGAKVVAIGGTPAPAAVEPPDIERISGDLHSLVMCMITLADTHFDFEPSEKECALSYIEWEIVLKSRELQKAFA